MQGLARLRYSAVKPLVQSTGNLLNIQVAVHWHYVNESLGLFLFYFLQLAVMATYISQDLIKLVPLLTIVFVFGRYVFVCVLSATGSSVMKILCSVSGLYLHRCTSAAAEVQWR